MGSQDIITSEISGRVLKKLIDCYFSGEKFYMSNRIGYLFKNDEASMFVSNEDIIKNIKPLISNNFSLQVDEVQRTFSGQHTNQEDFTFADTELKIIPKIK